MVLAEYAVGVVDLRDGQRGLRAEPALQRVGVEGLLVLPPPDVADEAVVVQLDALAAQLEHGVLQALVGYVGLVDLGVLGIRDDGKADSPVGRAVVAIGADRVDALQLAEGLPAAPCTGAVAQAKPDRGSGGVFGESVLVHPLEAVAQVDVRRAVLDRLGDGPALLLGKGRNSDQHQRGRSEEQAF